MADIGLIVRVKLGKRGEILVLGQRLSRLIHLLHIEWHVVHPRRVATERTLSGRDIVCVLSLPGIESGVCTISDRGKRVDRDIVRQHSVEFVLHLLGIQLGRRVEVRHVVRGIDTRIGTTRTDNLDRLSQQLGECRLYRLLHSGHIGLYLPAAVGSTIIFQLQKVSHNRTKV